MRGVFVIYVLGRAPAGRAAAQPADATISGRVVGESGEPIAGATVELGDHAVVTDDTGGFTIPGDGMLTVVAVGYQPITLAAKRGMTVHLVHASGEVIELSGKAPEETKPLEYTL